MNRATDGRGQTADLSAAARAYRRGVVLVLLGSVSSSWLGLALVLFTMGSRTVPAADMTLLAMTEVVLAPFWVWLVFGETAGVFTLIGGALLLAAVAVDAVTGVRDRKTNGGPR